MTKNEKIRFLKNTNEDYFDLLRDLKSDSITELYKINAIQNVIIQNYQTIIKEYEENERKNNDFKRDEIC